MTTKHVFTTWEAGRYCDMSPYTIRNWIKQGRLKAYTTPGGHHRILRRELDAFLLAEGMPLPGSFTSGGKRALLMVSDQMESLAKAMASWADDLEVLRTDSAFEAGKSLLTFEPNLVLVDLEDERWDGLAVCRSLYESPRTSHLILGALVAEDSVELLEAAQEAGVLASFTKPPDPPQLLRWIRRLFPYCRWKKTPKALRKELG